MNANDEFIKKIKEESKLFTCDKGCGEGFEINEMKVEASQGVSSGGLPDRIEKRFFTCPHCGTEYVSFYTDTEMRDIKDKAEKVWNRLSNKLSEEERRKIKFQHDKLMGQFRNRAQRLRRFEG